MASSDIRDVLNLTDGAAGPRPNKKARFSAPRPNLKGLAREVYSLGGDNPIAIVPEVTHFKKRRLASRKPVARWERKQFRNSGREDPELLLRHWRRVEEGKAEAQAVEAGEEDKPEGEEQAEKKDEIEDSTFAKFNVQVPVPQYTDDQYSQSLQNAEWSKEETDYLMTLARDFDLRWPLIWDRYDWAPPATNGTDDADGDESKAIVPATRSRSMEDLKARYYDIAAKMMSLQKPVQYMSQPEFALHELMAHFNPTQEKLRKDYALNTLSRPSEDAREEESLLLEIKRILARSERFNEERRELYHRLDYPHAETADISSFKSSTGLQTLLQTLMTVDKTKKRRSLMGPDGISPGTQAAPGTAQEATSRRDSTAMANSNREGTAASTTATPTAGNKKGQQGTSQATPSQQQQQQSQQPQERRKLTAQEEAIYGITHLDRSGSGPSFRSEKLNKLFTHKSVTQQGKISNVLTELDVPARMAMPCAATTAAYEALLVAVNTLLDARKVSDKLDAEIKLEQAKKREREGIPEDEEEETEKTEENGVKEEEEQAGAEAGEEAEEEGAKDEVAAANGAAEGEGEGEEEEEEEEDDGDADKADGDEPDAEPAVAAVEAEEAEEAAATNGTAQKRSASVLSAVSDKSAKRQKK